MYQRIGRVEAVQQIDSIVEQSKVRRVSQTENDIRSTLNNQSQPETNLSAKEELEELASEANNALEAVNTQIVFQVHERTGRPLIKLVESASQEVIREIPAEKMLDVLAGIWEWAGLIVDRKE